MAALVTILADVSTASGAAQETFRFAKLQPFAEERWFYIALVAVSLAVVAFVVWLYRRDAAELKPGLGVVLAALRLTAFAAALFYFLDLEKRTERQVVHNSRVLLLVDTSQSMGLHDSDASSVPAAPSRMDQVVAQLSEGTLIEGLRRAHDVAVFRFDRDTSRIVSLAKSPPAGEAQVTLASDGEPASDQPPEEPIDWKAALIPQGTETRLGAALKRVLDEERAGPVSAVVVITDGGQNSGIDPSAATEIARDAKVPIYPIGMGSDRRPVNVRVSDLVAPSRAYPGDSFHITGYVQAQGLENRTVTVELLSREASEKNSEGGVLEDQQRVALGADGEVVPVKFELRSEEVGRRTYRLRVDAPPEDRNPNDNHQEADVEVIDRKTHVLLLASGATREYQFLRNQLRRDKDVIVDVLLQSSPAGISQDADEILDDFPITKEELYKYDVIVGFDPNWNELDPVQIDLLESWVAEEAGGLIAIAGPVHTDSWTRSPRLAKLRNLHPVEFQRRFSLLADAEFGSKTPWPIELTRDGIEAEFLWLEDSAIQSQVAWTSFEGVYGYYSVKRAKPGATVYGRFSDPEAVSGDEQPVYLAGHFYGSGRVFYLGSGEMWRLRALDEGYFERFYTKLVRHVSQGRLLKGSTRGVLLVERDRYLLGDTLVVRAQLSDSQHDPLDVPSVALQVTRPDSTAQTLVLKPDPSRKGMYVGQTTVLQEGVFRLDLPVPETLDEQLTRRIQVRVPDLERENPQRNDALLSELAQSTGGLYYVGLPAALGAQGAKPLLGQLRDRTETTTLTGSPDVDFKQHLMHWLLGVIAGALCLEWLIRRLSKLA